MSSSADSAITMDQFAALNLPNKSRRQIENRFDKACKVFKRRLKDVDDAFKKQRLEQLYALHKLCVQTEGLALGPQPDTQAVDDIQARWADAEKPAKDKPFLHSIEQRYRTALAVINGQQDTDVFGDLAVNADLKSTICTDLEILLHLESPAGDHNQRMQRQVELMENAMKGVGRSSPERIRELKLEYMSCGPVDSEKQQSLEQRFSLLLNSPMQAAPS